MSESEIKPLVPLYSRTETGAVQVWIVEVQDQKLRTISGQVDGKKMTSEWTVCSGKNVGRKNETTPEQQAQLEAQAKWKKKLDSGYKESQDGIDQRSFVEPMLAKSFDDYRSDVVYPVYSQPKYDGIRCVVTSTSMKSRSGKLIVSAPHIKEALAPLFQKFPDLVLDGELYCDKFANDFNKICSLVKKTKPTPEDILESAASIQYWIYDIAEAGLTFSERSQRLDEILPKHQAICTVPTEKVDDVARLDALYEKYMADGYEGQMVRTNALYEFKRSKNLLKRKEFKDEEFVILGVVEGEGNKTGMAASMLFKNSAGTEFNSNIKGDHDHLRSLLANKSSLLGKAATVKYFNLTPDGIPRFPYVIAIRDYE